MLFYKVLLLVIGFVSQSSCRGNIVKELTKRFYDVSNECFDANNETQPLYKCSGIIIRGVRSYGTKFAWSLKPADKEKNSFAMGFLRNDHSFSRLGKGYDAGFILYPHLLTPNEKNTQKVLCAFPVDAYTDYRGDRGCGLRNSDTIGSSQQCDAQNITSFTQWLSHFNKTSSENPCFQIRQCGFDMTKETAAQNFAVARDANKYLHNSNTRMSFISSELRVEGWDENNTKQIPIQSFFHFIDSDKGYENAVKYQHDFYTQSGGEKVPIVGIRLPTASNPNIYIEEAHQRKIPNKFHYSKNEQNVDEEDGLCGSDEMFIGMLKFDKTK